MTYGWFSQALARRQKLQSSYRRFIWLSLFHLSSDHLLMGLSCEKGLLFRANRLLSVYVVSFPLKSWLFPFLCHCNYLLLLSLFIVFISIISIKRYWSKWPRSRGLMGFVLLFLFTLGISLCYLSGWAGQKANSTNICRGLVKLKSMAVSTVKLTDVKESDGSWCQGIYNIPCNIVQSEIGSVAEASTKCLGGAPGWLSH